MEKRKIIAIVGPTASGKTGWGVYVAKKLNGLPTLPSAKTMQAGEIISADSRQIFRGLNIGTGKDLKEYGEIKHYLIDICNPGEKFTMFDWLDKAKIVIEDIFSRGKTPIIVGGTGLYIQAFAEGFELSQKSKVESRKSNLKLKIYSREKLEKKPLGELQKIFLKLQIENCKIDLNNPHRLIRVIERAQSGEVVTKRKPDFQVLQIAVDLPREVLYQRIDQRVEEWFEDGFVEEIQGLLNTGVDSKWLEKIGLEYKILTEFLLCHSEFISGSFEIPKQVRNDNEFKKMKQKMKYAIHAYARRQLTWFRRFPEIIWCKDIEVAEKEIEKFLL